MASVSVPLPLSQYQATDPPPQGLVTFPVMRSAQMARDCRVRITVGRVELGLRDEEGVAYVSAVQPRVA